MARTFKYLPSVYTVQPTPYLVPYPERLHLFAQSSLSQPGPLERRPLLKSRP